MPPASSSAFSSTSWLDFFLFSRTGNLAALALGALLVLLFFLLAWGSRSHDPDGSGE